MTLDTGTLTAFIIALCGACITIVFLMSENKELHKKVRILQVSLRDERRKER
jgi:hypothetical protein